MNRDLPIDFLINIFSSSSDEIFIIDFDGNILFKNQLANKLYPKVKNINKLAHLFNFEICILKSEDIMTYTPLYAAIVTKEEFRANLTKQINEKKFIDYEIISIPYDINKKIIILKNDINNDYYDKFATLEKKNNLLEEQVISAGELKNKLENQLLRTNLINLVSDKVREYIDTKKIIKIVLEQLKKTLDITKAEFVEDFLVKDAHISSEVDEKHLLTKLFVPVVYGKKNYGVLVLYRKNLQNTWQKEEIDLVKNICSLLSTSFSKNDLYQELEEQKKELEKTLDKLKNAQLQIVQAEKMASLGQLVAGVAHEINTPLGAISSNIDLLDKIVSSANSKEDLISILNEIMPVNKEAIRRISQLIKSLKNFTRLDEAKKKKVDIKDGIVSTISLMEHEIKGKVTVKTDFQEIPMISCYPDYINQVFMNILLNACQSIKSTGEIFVSTYREADDIVVKIADNGTGIPKENFDRIFEFGFTTKKIGQGTGLGLALAKKIVDEHNGKIFVESELGKGTCFKIYLPIN